MSGRRTDSGVRLRAAVDALAARLPDGELLAATGWEPFLDALARRLDALQASNLALSAALRPYVADYDEVADTFYRETGLMAPGKDAPPHFGGTQEARQEAWTAWLRGRDARRSAAAQDALRGAEELVAR